MPVCGAEELCQPCLGPCQSGLQLHHLRSMFTRVMLGISWAGYGLGTPSHRTLRHMQVINAGARWVRSAARLFLSHSGIRPPSPYAEPTLDAKTHPRSSFLLPSCTRADNIKTVELKEMFKFKQPIFLFVPLEPSEMALADAL